MALINKKRDTYLFYKYRVHAIHFLFPDGDYTLENERVNSIQINEDYIANLYPIFKISVALEQSVYYRLIKNKDDVQIRLNVRKYYRENTKKEKSLFSNHIDTTFKLILNDNDDNLGEQIHNLEYPDGDTQQMNSVTMNIDLFLFKADIIRANREIINFIAKNISVSTALTYMLGKIGIGIKDNLLISPIDNTEICEYIKIPPLKMGQAIAYLDSYYGIHKTGSIIFFGFDRSYIIRYCDLSNAFKEGEEDSITVIVPKTGSGLTDNICNVRKQGQQSKIYLIADSGSFTSQNEDVTGKILNAEDVQVIDNQTGETTYDSSSKNKTSTIKKTENPFFVDIYNKQVQSNEVVLSCTFRDCLVEEITPNKKFNFIFEDTKLTKKYKGTYFLSKKDAVYVKDGKDLTVGATCEFRRM